jgi:nitroreductase
MDAFFTEGGQLDILVEECDSVEIKIMARQKAKALGIPVVMDMSDRGCLDVERFDLEPARPLMHGWIDHLDLEAASRPMTAEEKVPFMLPITGVDTLSPRMKASVIELGQSIGTWPQLATSVVLGGALAGDAVRRIALGQFHASGRWFVDMEELVSDHAEAAPAAPSAPSEFKPEAAAIAKIFQQLGPASGNAVDPGKAMVAQLVEAGGLAPSAGNMQPWKFLWKDRRLLLFQDTGRSRSWIDPDGLAARLALGAAMENVEVKAQELGFACTAASFPVQDNPTLAAAFTFSAGPAGSTEKHNGLAAMIGKRCTNRKVVRREPLPEGAFTALAEAVATIPGCQLHLTEDPEVLGRLAKLCGQAERIQWMNPDGHRDYFRQLRWTTEAAATSRDGLDLATLELLPMQEAALRVVSDRKAMDLIDGWQAGQGLERSAAFPVMNASAMLLLSTANDDAPAHLDAGRALERMWLRATALQLGIHPMPGPVLLPRLPAHAAQGLRDHERQAVATIGEELRACYHQGKRTPVFLLCLTRSEKPSMRSKRRPVEEILMLS